MLVKLKFISIKNLFILTVASVFLNISSTNAEKLTTQEIREMNRSVGLTWNKSDWWQHAVISSKGRKWQNENGYRATIIMPPPPCPTVWWNYYGHYPKAYLKVKEGILKQLKGFPSNTKEYCLQKSYLTVVGKLTGHPLNQSYAQRGAGTLVIRNTATGETRPFRIIQENDYMGPRSYAKFFNENLTEVCDLRFANDVNLKIVCGDYFGTFASKLEVTNQRKGEWKLFAKNDRFTIFATNQSLETTKQKYPKMFLKPGEKPCAWNCN